MIVVSVTFMRVTIVITAMTFVVMACTLIVTFMLRAMIMVAGMLLARFGGGLLRFVVKKWHG